MLYRNERTFVAQMLARLPLGAPPVVDGPDGLLRRYRWFLLFVIAPTVVVALYYLVFAADQYVSEARFMVRSAQPQTASVLGQVLGGAGLQQASEEAAGVASYLDSHDAAQGLQQKLDVVSMFRRTGLDFLGRIKAHPTEEDLTKYYQRHTKVTLNNSSGLITLEVRAFRPADSKAIADALLDQSEQLVNRFSERAQTDAVRVTQQEVQRAEKRVIDIGAQLTQFRNGRQAIDPVGASTMVMTVMGGLEGELAKARAELAGARAYLKSGNPRLTQLETRVAALESQVGAQRSRLAGGSGSLAPTVAGYDRLMVEREIANRAYGSALASLEAARVDAQKQHLYLVRVVEPNLAQKSLYPQRALIILTVFISLLVAYGIGWLIIAGVREHAA